MSRFFPIGIVVILAVSLPEVLTGVSLAQDTDRRLPRASHTITLMQGNRDSSFQLPHQFIIAATDSVVLDSARVLSAGIEYAIDYRHGRIRFDSAFASSVLADTHLTPRIVIDYSYLPFRFEDSYFRRKLVVMRDSAGRDTLRVSRPRSSFGLDDIFGRDLQKSGSIVRGFTVGSNRDFTLNSGLRLQLAGKLANDVEVVAALTDESTPIQPEGTSQTLQEFDKVFVELRSTDATATLGDFNLDLTGSEFARLSRKLQGAKAAANYRLGFTNGSSLFSAASTRGKYNTNQMQGIEAVQGPYRLTGRNNERQIIVIAGTERVYINGELQTRGETNDYTIDYSTGEVTFTPRRLITAASRITVDFEYSDRQYSRSLLAGQSSSRFFDYKANFTFSFLREGDDQDSPIDFSLTDTARAVLEAAGDDPTKAVLSGVTQVDSNGYYVAVDTLIGGAPVTFYRYAPGRDARYVISFSSVGAGKGEYIRRAVGVFEWRGPGFGDYLPVKLLPLPTSAQVMDFQLDVTPVSDLRIAGEFAASKYDANRLSSLSDHDNSGQATKVEIAYTPKDVSIGGSRIGSFEVRARERYVNRRFVPIDRTNDIEFERKWGIGTGTAGNEEIQEASLKYAPVASIAVTGGYGKITRGDALRSVRNDATLSIKGDSLPTVSYLFESVRSREIPSDRYSSWLRQIGSVDYRIGKFAPNFKYENERRRISTLSTAALADGSFSFNVFSPGLRIADIWKMTLASQLEWRTDNLFDTTSRSVIRESKSFTQSYSLKLSEWNALSSTLDVTLRDKKFTPTFKLRGNNDISTVLVRSQSRYAPLNRGVETDLFYEVATQRSSRLERVFVRVAVGTGNYKYLGDLNGNGVADEAEFELTRFDGDFVAITVPSDQLFPVIDLKTSVRLRVTPSRFLDDSPLGGVLNVVSTETYVRLEEKSTEPDLKKIYLLHFRRFQSDSTISGSTFFTQDVNFFEGRPAFSARLRFSQRTGLNKFASSSSSGIQERNFARERSLRLRWQLVEEIANQIDVVNRVDRVSGSDAASRLRDILSNTIAFDLSYRPYQQVEVGMKFEVGSSTDRNQVPAVEADLNTQSLRFVYAFRGAGQARVEASREEILLSKTDASLPYELTGGRVPGKTFLWRAAFDYRVTEFIQATVNYDGRSEGGRAPLHTGRAEVRAFF